MPRLGHKKSRNGCLQCKRRRVKCDEAKPCNHCSRAKSSPGFAPFMLDGVSLTSLPISTGSYFSATVQFSGPQSSPTDETRHGVECSLVSEDATDVPRVRVARQGPKLKEESEAPTPVSSSQSADITDVEKGLQSDLVVHGVSYAAWARDMELLHHFVLRTSYTFNPAPEIRRLYQDEWPKVGFAYKPALHGILAVTALHLAHLEPEQCHTYMAVSLRHQNRALGDFRLAIAHVTPTNVGALFILSIVISVCNMASLTLETSPRTTVSAIDDSVNLIQYCRGITQVLQHARVWLRGKPLGLLASVRLSDPPTPPLETPQSASTSFHMDLDTKPSPPLMSAAPVPLSRQSLNEVMATLSSILSDRTLIPSDLEHTIFQETLAAIKICFDLLVYGSRPLDPGIVLAFPVACPPGFVPWVSKRHPAALVLLSTWGAIAHVFSRFWWIGNRGRRVIEEAREVVALMDERWRRGMEWPEAVLADEGSVGREDFC